MWLFLLLLGKAEAPVGIGTAVPAFSLPDQQGHLQTLQTGSPSLLGFWASWCAPCVTELPKIEALSLRYPALKVLEVNLDAQRGPALGVMRALRLSLPVAFDPGGTLVLQMAPPGLPATYVLDAAGIIRATHFAALDDAGIASVEAELLALGLR